MAQQPIIIAKNVSSSPQGFLGSVIQPNGYSQISDLYFQNEITGSIELRALINSGDIVINNGIADLNSTEANALCSFPYSMLNATTQTISASTLIETEAIKITTGAGANKILTSDAVGDATWETPSGGSSTYGAVQMRRTSNLYTTGSYVDVTFNATDIETNTNLLSTAATTSIDVEADGLIEVSFQCICDPPTDDEVVFGARIRKNSTTATGGDITCNIYQGASDKEDWGMIHRTILLKCWEGDVLTVQVRDTSGAQIRITGNSIIFTAKYLGSV